VLDTPCVESRTLGQILGCQVFLKFENLQFTASFKERGALNKLATLVESGVPLKGVIAASAGNHAQGVAHHAQRLGLRAVIVMPLHAHGEGGAHARLRCRGGAARREFRRSAREARWRWRTNRA
jgi:threonine dehydratase